MSYSNWLFRRLTRGRAAFAPTSGKHPLRRPRPRTTLACESLEDRTAPAAPGFAVPLAGSILAWDNARAVGTDAAGDVYVLGEFTGTVPARGPSISSWPSIPPAERWPGPRASAAAPGTRCGPRTWPWTGPATST
jgi:hypothetical protein